MHMNHSDIEIKLIRRNDRWQVRIGDGSIPIMFDNLDDAICGLHQYFSEIKVPNLGTDTNRCSTARHRGGNIGPCPSITGDQDGKSSGLVALRT